MSDIKLLFEQILSACSPPEDLAAKSGIPKNSLATMVSRFKAKGIVSTTLGNLCRLAAAAKADPLLALLSFVEDRLRNGKDRLTNEDLLAQILARLSEVRSAITKPAVARESCGLGLSRFPFGFNEPFIVVTGDRRETGGKRMTPADLGAVSSSPADLRYLDNLGLPRGTQIITDKIFALAPWDELVSRFSEKTLIVLGSPASNHLARIINGYSLFRFDVSPDAFALVEELLRVAWAVSADKETSMGSSTIATQPFFVAPHRNVRFDHEALEKLRRDRDNEIRWFRTAFFRGGFIDPTYPQLLRGQLQDQDRDFALISLAQNPFRPENDAKYPAVFLAGYHLPGSCCALHPDIWRSPRDFFREHLLGGILRIDLKAGSKALTFYERIENFSPKWDDGSAYEPQRLVEGLEALHKPSSTRANISQEEAKRASVFLRGLVPAPGPGPDGQRARAS